MAIDSKTVYAQSSDIKSRTYLEYRKDMKKKAIAELEIIDWLENKLKELYNNKIIKVNKSGGDEFLWFLRKGGVSRKPDFVADIDGDKKEFEFQYADKEGLEFYDFKISKVAKRKKDKSLEPIKNKLFIYIYKPQRKYAIIEPEWIFNNSNIAMVEAWRTAAYRVPKDKFEKILKYDPGLEQICNQIDIKTYILNFQHSLIDIYKDKLSFLLQSVIDEDKIINIIPNELESYFEVCFILDNLNKVPHNANLWLVYLLSYITEGISLNEIAKILYCIDFLYSKIELKPNELNQLINKIKQMQKIINKYYQNDGTYRSSLKESPIEETRYALFSLNLIEDLIQDIIYTYSVKTFKPIKKIYQSLKNIEKTYHIINFKLEERISNRA
ncbi:MAG TPA: hypothetical protein PLT80_06545 [Candidatus Syntrophosphaera thermopropionivorans]|jgi:hypothetical protein|nr:hypothetical protein [Candidatus Syntrophosphaera thermopropionivorans]HQP84135.1 hypothetical protein [Candidatus Syntrophosphaera thermopropionivorans]